MIVNICSPRETNSEIKHKLSPVFKSVHINLTLLHVLINKYLNKTIEQFLKWVYNVCVIRFKHLCWSHVIIRFTPT